MATPFMHPQSSLNTTSTSTGGYHNIQPAWPSMSSMSSCKGWSPTDNWRSVDSSGLCENNTGEQLSYQDIAEQHKEVCMLMKFLVYKGYVNEEEFNVFKNTFQKLEKF